MDHVVVAWFAAHRTPVLDAVMLVLTGVGRGGLVWALLALIRARTGRRLAMAAWQVILALLLSWMVADAVVKPLVHRPRPFVASPDVRFVGEEPRDYSMPSGHAATAVAGAYALSRVWPAGRAVWWLSATLIAVSRAYLGVHYPTDLLAGAILGWLTAWFVVGGTRWMAARPGEPSRTA